MKIGFWGIVLLLAMTSSLFANEFKGTRTFVEENDLYIGTDQKDVGAVTEEVFNNVLDKIEAIYGPIIAAKGKKLVIERKWEDGTVNAYAQQSGNNWMVSMFGGLARHEAITADGFALVACHELGHHLGGAPKKKGWFFSSWASIEGQSDYFATLKCLRKYFAPDNNREIIQRMEVPAMVTDKCSEVFANADDIAICQRGTMAGYSTARLFKALRNEATPVDVATPDPAVVANMQESHPATQCRMDTYFAGALCDKDVDDAVSNSDAREGTCTRSEGLELGVRPLCWFKPNF